MDYALKAALAMLQNKIDNVDRNVKELLARQDNSPNGTVIPGSEISIYERCPNCNKPVPFDPEHLTFCKVDKANITVICPYCATEWFGGIMLTLGSEETKGENDADERSNPES